MTTALTGGVIPWSSLARPPLRHRHCFLTAAVRGAGSTGSSYVPGFLAAAVLFSSALQSPETLSNVPQTLSGDDSKQARIQRPKSRNAESCTVKCVTTCIRGGAGSPGEGPLNARSFDGCDTVTPKVLEEIAEREEEFGERIIYYSLPNNEFSRPLVVFKPGFRSRQYCLIECSDICNLINYNDDGP